MAKMLDMKVEKKNDGDYSIAQKDLDSFLNERGLTKETFKALQKADNELIEGATKFLKPHVIKTKAQQKMLIGSGNGQRRITVNAEKTAFKPPKKKGDKRESFQTWGSVSFSVKRTIPGALKNGALKDIQKDIEKALK